MTQTFFSLSHPSLTFFSYQGCYCYLAGSKHVNFSRSSVTFISFFKIFMFSWWGWFKCLIRSLPKNICRFCPNLLCQFCVFPTHSRTGKWPQPNASRWLLVGPAHIWMHVRLADRSPVRTKKTANYQISSQSVHFNFLGFKKKWWQLICDLFSTCLRTDDHATSPPWTQTFCVYIK